MRSTLDALIAATLAIATIVVASTAFVSVATALT